MCFFPEMGLCELKIRMQEAGGRYWNESGSPEAQR